MIYAVEAFVRPDDEEIEGLTPLEIIESIETESANDASTWAFMRLTEGYSVRMWIR